VAEPAQRDTAATFEQHNGHAQLQQEQANALQRPDRAAEARQARCRADERITHHLGQACVALGEITRHGRHRQQQ